jgi:hypothetical protein
VPSVIVRDYEGNELASMCTIKLFVTDPIVCGAWAAWKVIEFCRDLGLQHAMIKEDALKIVHVMRKK